MNRTHVALLIAIGGLLLVTPAPAAIATPIYMPTSITTSGTYQLVNDIGPGPTHVIDIVGTGVQNIVIDLNGFTISPSGGYDGIHAVNVNTLVVRNGKISDPGLPTGAGIYVMGALSVQVDTVTTLGLDKGVQLVAVSSFDVGHSRFLGSVTYGVEVDGTGAGSAVQGIIHENAVRNAVMGGINVHDNHTNVEVRSNSVGQSTGGAGILLLGGTSCVIEDNKVRGNQTGIELNAIQWCNVTANIVTENSADGIALVPGDNVYVDHNVVTKNVASGILVGGDYNFILVNRISGNDGLGVWFQPPANNNYYQDNVSRYNTGTTSTGGVCPAPACPGLTSPDFCDDGAANTTGGNNHMPGPPVC